MLIHYSMSRKIVFSLCVLLCGALIALNGEAAEAARSGFALWQNSVMPALLPFFVCTGLMRKLGLISLGQSGGRLWRCPSYRRARRGKGFAPDYMVTALRIIQ